MLYGFERPDLFKKITFALLIAWMILIFAGMSQGGGYEARVQKSMDFCLGQTAFSGNTVKRTVTGMGMNMNYCESKGLSLFSCMCLVRCKSFASVNYIPPMLKNILIN